MNETNWHVLNQEGFLFFGKMTASISHEIKNHLAIMNENAGLLQDLVLLSQKGPPLDPERLGRVAQQLLTQIKRSDNTVKKLNQLAHTVDTPLKSIDLSETLELSVTLAQRLAKNKGFELSVEINPEKVVISTRVFYFLNMIWLCIDFVINSFVKGKQLILIPEKTNTCVQIKFKPLAGIEQSSVTDFMAQEQVAAVLEVINASLMFDNTKGEMILAFKS